MEYDASKFWTLKSFTPQMEYSTMYERFKGFTDFTKVQKSIINPTQKANQDLSFLNILSGKKITSQDTIISVQQKLEDDLDGINEGGINEDLSSEANEILEQINNEAAIKFLQMYFDSYMAPKMSDAQWRLGPVTGTVLSTDASDMDLGMIKNGKIYTRSSFGIPFFRKILSGNEAMDKLEYYSSMYFPPYKVGHYTPIDESTAFMKDILKVNPGATFNQDSFEIKKPGYTYREAGYKSINDYISFLQWVTEGCTGLVSTYLTEWDLSVYMQEGLLTATENGGPMKLFLNYRVRNDNPLADEAGNFTDDRALVFNVAGSAVSKIDFDCQKIWRPSDYPLSNWWTPYTQNRDWIMNWFSIHNEEWNLDIPYMSIYDDVASAFPYENKDIRSIVKQQDFLGSMLGVTPNWNLHYFQAFYYTDNDSLSDFDIKMQGWLKKVSGAEPGVSTKKKKAMNNFLEKAREEMLLNGGYYGSPTPPGLGGGYMGRMMMQEAMNNAGSDEKMTGGKMQSAAKKGAEDALENNEINQLPGSNDASEGLNAGLSNKADASNMCKYTGINRFAPALFGGPHGADYSPNTIQGYFDENNILLRNIPRLSSENSDWFKSDDPVDKFTDLNKFYDDGTLRGCSPNTSLSKFIQGIHNYNIEYGFYRALKTEFVEGTVFYNYTDGLFNLYLFPSKTPQGEDIIYKDNYAFRSKRFSRADRPWDIKSWWYQYLAYFNTFNTSYYYKVGSTYFYVTIAQVPFKLGTFYFTGMNPFKNYQFSDDPDVKWQIVHHAVTKVDKRKDFWDWMTSINSYHYIAQKYPKQLADSKGAFMLKFPEDNGVQGKSPDGSAALTPREREFMNFILKNKGPDAAVPFFFCEGNTDGRYSTGPDSIFRVKCKQGHYENTVENYINVKILFWTKRQRLPDTHTYVPFIEVDMASCDYMEDALTKQLYTNRFASGVDYPLHLKSVINGSTAYKDHPLQKFQNSSTFSGTVYSMRFTSEESGDIGDLIKALMNVMKAPTRDNANGLPGGFDWVSAPKKGLSGIGILSSIQGLDPPAENIKVSTVDMFGNTIEKTYNFLDYMKMGEHNRDLPFNGLDMYTHKIESSGSAIFEYPSSLYYWTKESMPKYSSVPMDNGLKQALCTIYTRALFFSETSPNPPGYYVGIDAPVRNFLSILMTQVSYFNFTKDALVEAVDLEVLRNALLNCVDKCVIKANGLSVRTESVDVEFDDEGNIKYGPDGKPIVRPGASTVRTGGFVTPDREHVLWNYWTETAIELFGDKSKHMQVKEELKTEFNRKINMFNGAIDTLMPICSKNVRDWTYNEVCTCYNLIYAMKQETGVGMIEKFLMSYLNILYNYRFYFVARRFNKENGTMWIMRALESVLDFVVPFGSQDNPPPPIHKLGTPRPSYNVAFYELSNPTNLKRDAILDDVTLDEDKIATVYIKVKWMTKKDYVDWIVYSTDKSSNREVPEIVEVFHNGITKYAKKPYDDMYTLESAEWLENDKNVKWNNLHKNDTQRVTYDYDTPLWQINWGDSPDLTPIKWDVFGTVNVDNLLIYAKESVSPEELICLMEEGADFWTVSIPVSQWPRVSGYKTKLKLRAHKPKIDEILDIKHDPMITMLGPMAYSVYPITQEQARPIPGVAGEIPDIYRQMSKGTNGYDPQQT